MMWIIVKKSLFWTKLYLNFTVEHNKCQSNFTVFFESVFPNLEFRYPNSKVRMSDLLNFGFFEFFLTNFKVLSRATKAIAVRTPVFGNPNSKVRIFALWSSSPCLQAKQELLHPNMWIVRVRLTSSDANHEGAHESRCQSSEFRSFWRFGFQFLKFAFLTLKFGSVRAFGARIPNFWDSDFQMVEATATTTTTAATTIWAHILSILCARARIR